MYRMIIADDESIECRAQERIIQEHFKNIELLPSVYNGIELLQSVEKENPDIIIADINMPGLNGLDALEILRMKSVDAKIIINTAYQQFDYIRRALVLGASDFLTKPMKEEKFTETIQRVISQLDKERKASVQEADSSEKMQKIRRMAESEVMSSILLGEPNETEFSVLFENLSGDYFGGLIAAVSLNGDKKMHLSRVEKPLSDKIRRYCTCLSRIHKDTLYLFLIPGQQVDATNYQQWFSDLIEKIFDELQKESDNPQPLNLHFGVSGWKYEFEQIREAVSECRIALQDSSETLIHFFETKHRLPAHGCLETALTGVESLAVENRWEPFEQQIKTAFSAYESQDDGLQILRLWSVKIVLQCHDKMYLHGSVSPDLFCCKVWNTMNQCETIDQLCAQIICLLKEGQKKADENDPRNQYVMEAILYMQKNYMNDLSLEQVAAQVGISPFYLSRLLKHQAYMNFVQLLTDIRITKAIELIIREDFTVKDIGSRVGYQSPTYFYKVFKKSTGMTIGEIREIFRR